MTRERRYARTHIHTLTHYFWSLHFSEEGAATWGNKCSLTQLAGAAGLYDQEADTSHIPGKYVLLESRSFLCVTSDQSQKTQELSC